jgi:hypothetical protein
VHLASADGVQATGSGVTTKVSSNQRPIGAFEMAKLTQEQIRDRAVKIVHGEKEGIRYSALVQRIAKESPETPVNTIHGAVFDLDQRRSGSVAKPSRGLYVSATSRAEGTGASPTAPSSTPTPKEREFYDSFAQWLQGEMEEVTEAHVFGGNAMKSKWGTPDVLGVYKPRRRDFVPFNLEIVSAEVKIDPSQSVVAFGQAAAYRLFSSKTYLVMPRTISSEDGDRLDALAMLFGIGLVFFDLDPAKPNFTIRTRAQRATPDAYYVNEFAKRLHQHDEDLFDKLFG